MDKYISNVVGKGSGNYEWYKADEVDAEFARNRCRFGMHMREINGMRQYVGVLEKRIRRLEKDLNDYKEGVAGMRLSIGDLRDERDRLRKALEEIQIEVRKPEKFPRDMEKWLKRADKRTKLKKIFDIAAEALKDT